MHVLQTFLGTNISNISNPKAPLKIIFPWKVYAKYPILSAMFAILSWQQQMIDLFQSIWVSEAAKHLVL